MVLCSMVINDFSNSSLLLFFLGGGVVLCSMVINDSSNSSLLLFVTVKDPQLKSAMLHGHVLSDRAMSVRLVS